MTRHVQAFDHKDMPAGIVLASLGADVVLTDLGPNLSLLADNCKANGMLSLSIDTYTTYHKYGCSRIAASKCLQ